MKRHFALCLLTAISLATLPSLAHAQSSYRLTDLGSRGARGLNNTGQVAGAVSTPDGARVFRWTDANANGIAEPGEFLIFSVPKGYGFASTRNYSQHLNNLGQVAGVVQKTATTIPEFGYIWNTAGTNGTSLTTSLGIQKAVTEAFGINDNADVVGIDYPNKTNGNVQSAYLWKLTGASYSAIKIPSLPGSNRPGGAVALNNARQVVGWSGIDAFVWSEAAGLTALGRIPGHAGESGASAINNAGYIVGSAGLYSNNDPTGWRHAYLWLPSTDNGTNFILFDIHPGGNWVSSLANDVNNVTTTPIAGGVLITFQVVGQAEDASGAYAVVWDVSVSRTSAGQSVSWTMTNLNDRIDPASGWLLGSANAVNDHGQILCDGRIGSQSHPVLLTPP